VPSLQKLREEEQSHEANLGARTVRAAIVLPLAWDASWLTIDPTLLVQGFASHADDALICCEPGGAYETGAPVIELEPHEMRRPRTWKRLGVELAIVFTWMTNYNEVLRALRAADAFVVSKGDTDGLLVARVNPGPTLERMMFAPTGPVGKARNAWFWMKRWAYLYRRELESIVENIETATVTAVELEGARSNIRTVLEYAGRAELWEKVVCIPNPVPESFVAGITGPRARTVVSIGRWNDPQKNPRLLRRVLQEYCGQEPSVRFVLVGTGSERVCEGVLGASAVGRITRAELGPLLMSARVCLITSRWESFHIAGHEALACGCSVVGTPIEAVRSMVGDGSWGTIAADSTVPELVEALGKEMLRWDSGEHDPASISAHWRENLRPGAVVGRYRELAVPSSLPTS
jgi:hypothetical protein